MSKIPFFHPPFPALPPSLGAVIGTVSHDTQTPPEMSLGVALTAISAATQAKFAVEIRPGYLKPLNTWWVTVAEASSGKSTVNRKLTEVLASIEGQENTRIDAANKEIRQSNAELRALIAGLRKKLPKVPTCSREKAMDEIAGLEAKIQPERARLAFVAQEFSEAALADELLAQPGHALSVIEPECTIFSGMTQKKRALLLGCFSGDRYVHQTRKYGKVYIEKPLVSLSVMPQPVKLNALQEKDSLWEEGFFPRCGIVFVPPNLGFRNVCPVPADGTAMAYWNRRISELFAFPWREDGPHILRMSGEAWNTWLNAAQHLEQEMRPFAQYATIREWAGRARDMIPTIAALFHCLEVAEPVSSPISGAHMQYAINVISFLVPHVRYLHELICPDILHVAMRKIASWLHKRASVPAITLQDTVRNSPIRNRDVAFAALEELIQIGVLLAISFHNAKGNLVSGYTANKFALQAFVMENAMN